MAVHNRNNPILAIKSNEKKIKKLKNLDNHFEKANFIC